jgi:hypothetical protein
LDRQVLQELMNFLAQSVVLIEELVLVEKPVPLVLVVPKLAERRLQLVAQLVVEHVEQTLELEALVLHSYPLKNLTLQQK